MENNLLSSSNITLCYAIVKVITQQYLKLLNITSKCLLAAMVLIVPLPCIMTILLLQSCATLVSLNHGRPNNIK